MNHLIRFPFVTVLLRALKIASWQPAAGQAHPQKALPKKMALTSKSKNIMKLPLMIPFELASIISTGEK